jgi:hypothetical protein
MANITPTQIPVVTVRVRPHRLIWLAAAVALALAAVLAAILISGSNDSDRYKGAPSAQTQNRFDAVRADGGPEETGVAASVGSQPPGVAADESRIAAAIGSGRKPAPAETRLDESRIAAAIGSDQKPAPVETRLNESSIAAAISGN